MPIKRRSLAYLCCAICAPVLLGSALATQRSSVLRDPYFFLRTHVGFGADATERVRSGEAVATVLDTPINREIAVFGVVWIDAPVDRYLERYRDIEQFEAAASLQIKKLAHPPTLSDFAELTLEENDLDLQDLRDCELGDCEVKLGQESLTLLRRGVDWSSPDAHAVVTRLLRRLLFEYTVAYQEGGNRALAVYRDKERPTFMSQEFEELLENVSFLPIYAPELHRYLLDYPNAELPNSEEFFYWATNEFGLKPTTRVNHVVIYRPEWTDSAVIASKQIYGSHYFHTALELRALWVDPNRPGFYFMVLNRSRTDGLEGFVGMLLRGRVRSRARDSLHRLLEYTKQAMEQ